MDTPTLQILTVSTRESRKGPAIASWFEHVARSHAKFDVGHVDLASVALPLMNEAHHPRLRQYQHDHTRAWSATVEAADAFVFVTPEYNYATPPSLVNALDYLVHEWAYKPVGFVSYGGMSGGLRGVQMTKQIVTALKMMPIPEAVAIPFFNTGLDAESGVFTGADSHQRSATVMLDELLKWTTALRSLRITKD